MHVEVGALFTTPTLAGLAGVVSGNRLQAAVPSDAVPDPGSMAPGQMESNKVEIYP
jgi:hypothetical protein